MSARARIQYTANASASHVTYRADIVDSQYEGSAQNKLATGVFFDWEYPHIDERNPFENPVQSSSFVCDLLVQGEDDMDLLQDILDSDEDRFTIKFYKNGELEYSGKVLTDLLKYSEGPFPFTAQIVANDLSKLKGVSFDFGAPSIRGQLSVIISECLKATGLELPIRSYTNVTNSQADDQEDDFLYSLWHERRAFSVGRQSLGSAEFGSMNCLEVLEHICVAYNLIIKQSGARWIIDQLPAVAKGDDVQFDYDSDGKNPVSSTPDRTVNVDGQSAFMLPGSENKVTGALKSVTSHYNHRTLIHNIPTEDVTHTSASERTPFTLDFDNEGAFVFSLDLDIVVQLSEPNPQSAPFNGFFIVRGIRSGQDDLYMNQEGEWSEGQHEINVNITGTGETPSGSFSILQESTVPSAVASIVIDPLYAEHEDEEVTIESVAFKNIDAFIYQSANIIDRAATINHRYTRSGNYSVTEKIPVTVIGDGPTNHSPGAPHNQSLGPSNLTPGTFRIRGTTELLLGQELMLRERVNMRRQWLRNIRANLWMNYSPEKLISYRGQTWFFLGGNFQAKNSRWDANILALDYDGDTAGDSFQTIVEEGGDPSGSSSGSGSSGSGVSLSQGDARWLQIANALSELDGEEARENLEVYSEGEIEDFFSGDQGITGYNKEDWDEAFGWGDHSQAGYLTSSDIGVDVQAHSDRLDTLSDLTAPNASAIVAITSQNWGYVGSLDQGLGTDDDPSFTGMHIDTETGSSPFEVSRNGDSAHEVLTVSVVDRAVEFDYTEDTTAEGNGNFGTYSFYLSGDDGEDRVRPFYFNKDAVTVDTDLIVNGDIIQNGSAYETHAEQIYTTKDFIISREDAISALPAGGVSGMKVMQADGSNDVLFGADNTGMMRVGWDGDDLQALLTRREEADLHDNGVLLFDKGNLQSYTDSGLLYEDGVLHADGLEINDHREIPIIWTTGSDNETALLLMPWDSTARRMLGRIQLSRSIGSSTRNTYTIDINAGVGNGGDKQASMEVQAFSQSIDHPYLATLDYDGDTYLAIVFKGAAGSYYPNAYGHFSGISVNADFETVLYSETSDESVWESGNYKDFQVSELAVGTGRFLNADRDAFLRDIEGRDTDLSGALDVDGLSTLSHTDVFGELYVDEVAEFNDIVTYHDTIASDNFAESAGLYTGIELGQSTLKAEVIRANELRVKAFTAEVSAALYGEDILTKSRGVLSRDFTVPAVSGTATLYVEDLEGVPDTAVFESGDWIRLRVVDRSGGGLVVANVWGKVTSYSGLSGGEQSWTFTRESGGSASSGDIVYTGSIAIDYGVSGDSVIVRSVIGDHTPRDTQLTWTTSPISSSNYTIVTRVGDLGGIEDTTGTGFYGARTYLSEYLLAGDLTKSGQYLEYSDGDLTGVFGNIDFTSDTFSLDASNIYISSSGNGTIAAGIGNLESISEVTGFYASNGSALFGNLSSQFLYFNGASLDGVFDDLEFDSDTFVLTAGDMVIDSANGIELTSQGDHWRSDGDFQFGGSNGIQYGITSYEGVDVSGKIVHGSDSVFFGDVSVQSLPRLSDEGLEGLWQLDRSLIDSTGNTPDAEAANEVSYVQGVSGYAADFNADNEITFEDTIQLRSDESWYISCWVYLEDTTNTGNAIFGYASNQANAWSLFELDGNGSLSFELNGNNTLRERPSLSTIHNVWQLVIAEYDHSTSTIRLRRMTTEEDQDSAEENYTDTGNFFNSNPIAIGSREGDSSRRMNGSVAHCRIVRGRVTTERERKSLYLHPSGNSGGLISAETVRSGVLESTNLDWDGSSDFTEEGTLFDLNEGHIRSSQFSIVDGNATFGGVFDQADGTLGNPSASSVSSRTQNSTARITGGSMTIRDGSDETDRISMGYNSELGRTAFSQYDDDGNLRAFWHDQELNLQTSNGDPLFEIVEGRAPLFSVPVGISEVEEGSGGVSPIPDRPAVYIPIRVFNNFTGNEDLFYFAAFRPINPETPITPDTPDVTMQSGDGLLIDSYTVSQGDEFSHYEIERATSAGGPFNRVHSTPGSSWLDTHPKTNTGTYYYRVRGVSVNSVTSGYSGTESGTYSSTGPATQPSNLNLFISSGSAHCSWANSGEEVDSIEIQILKNSLTEHSDTLTPDKASYASPTMSLTTGDTVSFQVWYVKDSESGLVSQSPEITI